MNCPTCSRPMIVLELEQIEMDYCTACQGIWLDAGELELMLENAVQAHVLLQSLTSAKSDETKRKCPICHKKMDKVNAGGSGNAAELIDRCPNNHGLWFDRGELHKILRMAHFDDDGKVKHLLGELFSGERAL